MTSALQAIIFDFDGVIADSEPLHFRAFQQALAEDGHELEPNEYYARYLGYDDVGMFQAFAEDHGLPMDAARVAGLVARKGAKLQAMMHAGSVLFPGAVEFVRTAASSVPIAIASGALRHEIVEVIEAAGVAHLFAAIVASGDTPESKPSPEPYRLAFERLRDATGAPLDPQRCVAIEDSRWGLESARGAGLRCVGVTNSYPADELRGAELVVSGLQALTLDALDRLCGGER
ncbi:MAG TPA: HAD family phosphatase [Vicinamibacterales bacterium]|nr:HAD family phosphatase [Vicinamibacterales bacterium]